MLQIPVEPGFVVLQQRVLHMIKLFTTNPVIQWPFRMTSISNNRVLLNFVHEEVIELRVLFHLFVPC